MDFHSISRTEGSHAHMGVATYSVVLCSVPIGLPACYEDDEVDELLKWI
jgi:hypothetical protein